MHTKGHNEWKRVRLQACHLGSRQYTNTLIPNFVNMKYSFGKTK